VKAVQPGALFSFSLIDKKKYLHYFLCVHVFISYIIVGIF